MDMEVAPDHVIEIFVKLQNKTVSVKVDPSGTVNDAKIQLAQTLNQMGETPPPPNQQMWLFAGKHLQDSVKLMDHNVQPESTVFLSIKPLPKDILNFDECCVCHCQAVDASALPCGHSSCLSCIAPDATKCPVELCSTPLSPTITKNWLASGFFDAKAEDAKMCEVCVADASPTPATVWCESCSRAQSPAFYCAQHEAEEHVTRFTKTHVRHPIGASSTEYKFSQCPKHNQAEEYIRVEDKKYFCPVCRDTDQRTQKAILVQAYADGVREELRTAWKEGLKNKSCFAKRDQEIQKDIGDKEQLLLKLEGEMRVLRAQIGVLTAEMDGLKVDHEKALTAEVVLGKTIDEFPLRHLLDQEKVSLLRGRLDGIVKQLFPQTQGISCEAFAEHPMFQITSPGILRFVRGPGHPSTYMTVYSKQAYTSCCLKLELTSWNDAWIGLSTSTNENGFEHGWGVWNGGQVTRGSNITLMKTDALVPKTGVGQPILTIQYSNGLITFQAYGKEFTAVSVGASPLYVAIVCHYDGSSFKFLE